MKMFEVINVKAVKYNEHVMYIIRTDKGLFTVFREINQRKLREFQ